MLKVGIIGLGKMGKLHMMNCLQFDDVKVVSAADPSKNALERAKAIGVRNLYTDYHDLLDHSSDLDAVLISLPNFLHFESIDASLRAGLNVFVEKPLASTVEECRKITKIVDESGKKLMIGHCMRFYEAIEKMKNDAEKGFLGTLETVTLEEIINGPFAHGAIPTPVAEWWFDPKKAGGGVLLDIGYHLIDLFRFFAGDSKLVFCSLDHKYNLPVEDGAIIILQSSALSAKGIINVGWYQKTVFPRYNFRVILHGNAGYVSTDDLIPKNLYLHAAREGTRNVFRRIIGKKIRPLSYTYYYEAYYKELAHFFACLKNGVDPTASAADGLRTVELIEEAYKTLGKNN